MLRAWQAPWGTGRGPARMLAPHVRLAVGAGLFAVCLVAPADAPGVLVVTVTATSWLVACRPPGRCVWRSAALCLVFLLPYVLFSPLGAPGPISPPSAWQSLAAVGLLIVGRGVAATLVSIATVTAMTASDLRAGLARLRAPWTVSALVLQILHQAGLLAHESGQIVLAYAVRAQRGGWGTRWLTLCSLPRVWLPRVVARAERVAAAMDVRGFGEAGGWEQAADPMGARDAVAVGLVSLAMTTTLVLRWWTP